MFSESAEVYDTIYTAMKDYRREAADLAALVRKEAPSAVHLLDVACGTGEHARYLNTEHGFQVDGLDLDPKLVEQAVNKNPQRHFVLGDMVSFDLEKQYDTVLCLFSSIGYVGNRQRLDSALACFARHTRPGGLVVVEPWFEPGAIQDGYTTVRAAEAAGCKVARVTRNVVQGRTSTLHFEYLVADPSRIRHLVERHELALFTRAEMTEAFDWAGLSVRFDDAGISGRGLYIGYQSA